MSKKKLFKVSAACAGMLVGLGLLASNSKAVQILGHSTTVGDFGLRGCSGNCYYLGAYEYYGNQGGVIVGNYKDGENPLIVKFKVAKNYNNGENVSVRLTGAKFVDPSSYGADEYCLYNGTAIVAEQTGTPSYPTNQIFFQFNTSVPSGTTLTLGSCYYGPSWYDDAIMIQLDPGLGASCTNPAYVYIEWVAAGDCCNATLLQITSKETTHARWNFTAELDADNDFKTFLGGGTILDLCCERGAGKCECGYAECTRPSSGGGIILACPTDVWVLGSGFEPSEGNILQVSFGVHSLNPEPGVSDIRFVIGGNPIHCTKQSDTDWLCRSDCIPCPTCDAADFYVELSGTVSNNPTLWSIVNPQITNICPTDPKVKDVCCVIDSGYAGYWYGGLEAIVPFMRADSESGYATTMKFINRYGKEVKVLAQPFKDATDPMILPVTLVGTIQANGGVLTITAQQLASLFPTANFKDGTSVKFLLMVPPQAGCESISDSGKFNGKVYSEDGDITFRGGFTGSGTACYNNPGDPYVEGYVVYDTPQGTRTVPLKYKYWKQGGYNE